MVLVSTALKSSSVYLEISTVIMKSIYLTTAVISVTPSLTKTGHKWQMWHLSFRTEVFQQLPIPNWKVKICVFHTKSTNSVTYYQYSTTCSKLCRFTNTNHIFLNRFLPQEALQVLTKYLSSFNQILSRNRNTR